MRNIITIILLLISGTAFGQGTINFGASRSTDTGLTKGQLKFSAYANSNTSRYLTVNSNGYVVFGVPSGGGGSADSTVFFTVYRGDTMRRNIYSDMYVDSILFATNINSLDSTVLVIFGAINDLYDIKADKDTLGNFLLKSDTTTLSNRINLKQNFSDTTTYDATRYWVSTQIPALVGYVPYTGATGNVDLGTHTISAYNGVINHVSGSGTALSVTKGGSGEALTVTKTSGSGNAMSVSGGVTQLSELHTTTAIADAYIASAATWNAKGNGTVTSISGGYGLTGGTITSTGTFAVDSTLQATRARVQKQIDSVAALSGGGSSTIIKANEFNVLYKANGDTTIRGTTKLRVDTTDLRIEFAYDSTTSTVTTDPHGGVKFWGSNRMGMGAIRINDTVSIPAALQRAINAQNTSTIVPFSTSLQTTNAYSYYAAGNYASTSALSNNFASYSSTIQRLGYNYAIFITTASANLNAGIFSTSLASAYGLVCGNTKFSGGGGRGTFTFCLPTYLSTQRIFVGYSTAVTAQAGADPSLLVNGSTQPAAILGVGKDATDGTLQFMHSVGGVGATTTKVSTGITPNNENVYRVTVYVAPNSTFYIQLEVMSKTAATQTVVLNPTTNVPAVQEKLVSRQIIGNGLTGGVVHFGFINHMEEIY